MNKATIEIEVCPGPPPVTYPAKYGLSAMQIPGCHCGRKQHSVTVVTPGGSRFTQSGGDQDQASIDANRIVALLNEAQDAELPGA